MAAWLLDFELFIFAILGVRFPGVLLSGTFLTYQIGAVTGSAWVGSVYVAYAVFITLVKFAIKPQKFLFCLTDIFGFLLFIALEISHFWAFNEPKSTNMSIALALSFVTMFIIGRLTQGDPRNVLSQILVSLALGSALTGIAMLSMRATGTYASDQRLLIEGSDASAVGLTQPIPLALLASILLIAHYKGWFYKICGIVCIIPIVHVGIATGTRSVFMASIASIAAYILISLNTKSFVKYILLAPMVPAIFFMFQGNIVGGNDSQSFERLTQNFSGGGVSIDRSAQERLDLYGKAIELIQENPFFGVGFGGFGKYAFLDYPHNMFLEITVSAGAFSLCISFMWLISSIFDQFSIGLKDRKFAAAIFSMFFVALLQMQVSFPFSAAKPLFVIISLISSMRHCRTVNSPLFSSR